MLEQQIDAAEKKRTNNKTKLESIKKMKKLKNIKKLSFSKIENLQKILIPEGPRLGPKVIDIHNISLQFGNKIVFSNVNLSFKKNSIFGFF